MNTWDSLFEQAKWKCEGSYKAQASINGGLDVQMRFSSAGNTFPKVPFLLAWPEQLDLLGLVLTPGFATAKISVGGVVLEGLEVFARQVTAGALQGAVLGIKLKSAGYPLEHWGDRLARFVGAPNHGIVQVIGLFDLPLPDQGHWVLSLPVGLENLEPKPEMLQPPEPGQVDSDDIRSRGIVPLGALSPQTGHVLPSPHHNLVLAKSVLTGPGIPVVAPCSGIVHRIVHRIILTSQGGKDVAPWIAYHDFAVHIAAGPKYDTVVGHLHGLSPVTFGEEDLSWMACVPGMPDIPVSQEAFAEGLIPGIPAGKLLSAYALDVDKSIYSAEFDAWRSVVPGQEIGTAGGYALFLEDYKPENTVRWGAADYSADKNKFASPATYEIVDERMLFAKSPLGRLAGRQLASTAGGAIWRKEGQAVAQPFGRVSYDRPATIAGNWFAGDAMGEARALPSNQLALVYDVWDEKRPLISVGDEGLWMKSLGVEGLDEDGVYRVSAWAGEGGIEGLWETGLEKLESEPMLVELRPRRGPAVVAEGASLGPATLVLGTQKAKSGWELIVVMIPLPIGAVPHGCKAGDIIACLPAGAARVYRR